MGIFAFDREQLTWSGAAEGLPCCAAAIALALVCMAGLAQAHELRQGTQHVDYRSWVNLEGKGCCDNSDCRPISYDDERTVNGKLEVFVRGEGVAKGQSAWCPVLQSHYLKTGNAANWQSSHACVWSGAGSTPCTQFICYQPKPLF